MYSNCSSSTISTPSKLPLQLMDGVAFDPSMMY
jgi:hypothetical protein